MTGVLTGSNATRQRHTQQAKIIQSAISERWGRENPWTWQRKYLTWFLNHRMDNQKEATRYYYQLTIQLIAVRLGKKNSNI